MFKAKYFLDLWSKWHRIYLIDPILYESSKYSRITIAKNRFGKTNSGG